MPSKVGPPALRAPDLEALARADHHRLAATPIPPNPTIATIAIPVPRPVAIYWQASVFTKGGGDDDAALGVQFALVRHAEEAALDQPPLPRLANHATPSGRLPDQMIRNCMKAR